MEHESESAGVGSRGRIVIAGGSGFLGVSLAQHLIDQGWTVVIVSRSALRVSGAWRHACWDGRTMGDWVNELDGVDGLVNLAGRSVDCIKNSANRDEILRSRVEATRVLGKAVRAVKAPPPVWVQMSTAHIYGDPPFTVCDEESSFGEGLAPLVGTAWEDEFRSAVLPIQRGVVLRTSFVIGRDRGAGYGALARLAPLAKCGLGGTVGKGTQGMSWIHETDMNRVFERALTDSKMHGPYIASSPQPVSNREFMRTLRQVIGVPFGLPAASWMVHLGSRWLLRTDPELALLGRYVMPRRLIDEGFEFKFQELRDALADILARIPTVRVTSALPDA